MGQWRFRKILEIINEAENMVSMQVLMHQSLKR